MEKLQIHTGQIRLEILDDSGESRGIFKFNPDDTAVAKRIFSLSQTVDEKMAEYETKAKDAKDDKSNVELLDETIAYFRGVIDEIYGNGTSDLLFGNAHSLSMFEDFFVGIMPSYKKASEARVKKYSKKTK